MKQGDYVRVILFPQIVGSYPDGTNVRDILAILDKIDSAGVYLKPSHYVSTTQNYFYGGFILKVDTLFIPHNVIFKMYQVTEITEFPDTENVSEK